MGFITKAITGIIVIAVVVIGGVGYLATVGVTKQCPAAQLTSMTSKQVGDTLDSKGTIAISNGDATTVGRSYLGSSVPDLQVCFDAAAGHASGSVSLGPVKLPFYLTATSVDLSGSSPRIIDIDFEAGSVPSSVTKALKSSMMDLINGSLSTIKMTKRYTYQFGNSAVTVSVAR